jgi:hypothetical protein
MIYKNFSPKFWQKNVVFGKITAGYLKKNFF